jgi:hypothetical protein
MLVRLERVDDYNCNGSGFLRAPVQSQRWDKKEKDNHYPQVCEKVQGKRPQFFFVHLKPFAEPWTIGMPQSHGGNPIEEGKENTNSKGTQEKVSEENDFFAFHDSSIISDEGIGARLFGPTKSA